MLIVHTQLLTRAALKNHLFQLVRDIHDITLSIIACLAFLH